MVASYEELAENREGYYCLAIALFHNCTVEKAIAIYENQSSWITDDIVDEIIRMRKIEKLSLRQLVEIYGISKSQILAYIKAAELKRIGVAPVSGDPG